MLGRVLFIFLLAHPCVALAQNSCGASPAEISALRELLKQDPVKLAQAALAKKDNRFLAVAGYAITVPGIEVACSLGFAQSRIMPGTTDFICNTEHKDLINRAYTFAEKYNSYLKETFYRNGIKCIP